MANIGKRIKEIRKQKGLTQKELGIRLGVSQAVIAQYESGKRNPKIETLRRIAEVLNVPISELDSNSLLTVELKKPDGEIETRQLDATKLQQLIYFETGMGASDSQISDKISEVLSIHQSRNTLGENIKNKRTALGMSQKDLAEAINISQEAICRYESDSQNDIPFIIVKRLAKFFHVTINYLIFGSDEYSYNYPDLECLLNELGWGVDYVVPCSQYNNCLLTKEEQEALHKGYFQKKCKKCSSNRIDYVLYNEKKSYFLSQNEYDTLESCILPYLKIRVKEYLNQKEPLTEDQLKNMGLDWLTEL